MCVFLFLGVRYCVIGLFVLLADVIYRLGSVYHIFVETSEVLVTAIVYSRRGGSD